MATIPEESFFPDAIVDFIKDLIGSSHSELEEAIKGLRDDVDKHGETLKNLTDGLGNLAKRVGNLENDMKGVKAAIANHGKVEQKLTKRMDGLAEGLKTVQADIDGLKAAASSGPRPVLPPDRKVRDLLSLELRDTKIDPIALQALADLKKPFPTDRKAMIDKLIDVGAGANAQKIVRALSRKRLPDMASQILDFTLPHLMHEQFGNKIDERETADTVGATEALITRLQAADGPLKKFADFLVGRTIANMQINMNDAQSKLMAERVYQSLI
jgi:uncharacterized protein YoxC